MIINIIENSIYKKSFSKFPHCTTDKEVTYLTTFEVKTSHFYGQPKIHKSKNIETAVN